MWLVWVLTWMAACSCVPTSAQALLAPADRWLQAATAPQLTPAEFQGDLVPSTSEVELVRFAVSFSQPWAFDATVLPDCMVARRLAGSDDVVVFGRAAFNCPQGHTNISIPVFSLDSPNGDFARFNLRVHVRRAVLLLPNSEATVHLQAADTAGTVQVSTALFNAGSAAAVISYSVLASPPSSACAAHQPSGCAALSVGAWASGGTSGTVTAAPGTAVHMQPQLDIAAVRQQAGAAACAVAWLLLTSPGAVVDSGTSSASCAPPPATATAPLQQVVPVVVSLSDMQLLPRSQMLHASLGDVLTTQVALLLPAEQQTAPRANAVQVLAWNSSQPWLSLLQPTMQRLPGPVSALGLLLRGRISAALGFAAGPGVYGAAVQLTIGAPCSAPGVCSATHYATAAVFVRVFAGVPSPAMSSVLSLRTAAAPGSVVTGAVLLRDAAGTALELSSEQSVHVQAILQGIASRSAVGTTVTPLAVTFVSTRLADVAAQAAAAAAAPAGLSDAAFMHLLRAAADSVPVSASAMVAARPAHVGSFGWEVSLGQQKPVLSSGPTSISTASCDSSSNLMAAPAHIGGCSCLAGTQPDFARLLVVGWTSLSDPWLEGDGGAEMTPHSSGNVSLFHVLSAAVPCVVCPMGTYRSGAASSATGNTSVPLADLQCAVCPEGTYSMGAAASCLPCPGQGASCPNGRLQLFPGYWSPPLLSSDTFPAIIKCVNLGDCQPVPALTAGAAPRNTSTALTTARRLQASAGGGVAFTSTPLAQCRAGHTGILCRTCTVDRTLAFGQCLECPNPGLARAYIASAFMFLVIIPLAAVVLACHHRPCGCGQSSGQDADNSEWHRAAHAKERKLRAKKRAARAKRSEGRKDRRERDAEAEVTDDESSGGEEGGAVQGGKKGTSKGVDTSIVRIIKPASEMRNQVVPPGHGKRAGLRAPRRDAWDEKQRTKGQRGCRGRTRALLRAVFCCSYADGNDETPGQAGCWGLRPCCGRVQCRVVGDTSISGRHFLAVGPRNHTTYYVHEAGQVDDVLTQLRLLWHWLSGALLLLLFIDVAAPASVARSASLASGLLDAIAVSVSPQTWPWGCAMTEELRANLALPIDANTGRVSRNTSLAGADISAWADSYDSLQTSYGAPIFFAVSLAGMALVSCLLASARVQRYVSDLRSIAVWMSPRGPRAVIDASRVPARRCGCGPGQSLVPCCTKPLDAAPPALLDVDAPGLTPMEKARRKRANAAAYNPHTGARLIRSDDIPTGQRSGTVIGHTRVAKAQASPRRGTVVARAAAKASAAATATRDAVGLWCTGLFRIPSASNGMLVALLAAMLVHGPVLRGAAMAFTRLPQNIDREPHLRYAPELSAGTSEHTAVLLSSSALAVLLLVVLPPLVYILAYRAHTVLSRSRYRLYGPQQRFQASWDELHAPPPVVPLKTKRQVGPDGKMVTVVTPQWGFIQPGSIWRRAPLAPVPAAAWYHIAYVLSPLLAGLHENTVINWTAYDKAAAAAGLDDAGLLDDRARPWTHKRSGRLRRTLRAPRFWWTLLETARPVLLAAFGVIGQSQDKLLSLCVLCLFFLALQVAYFPYATRRQNLLAAGHLGTWLLLCMALQYTNARDLRDAVVALSQGVPGGDVGSSPAQGVSENDALSRDTTISVLSFMVITAWGAITLGNLLIAVFRLVFWPAVRAQYQWSITPGNRRYSCSHVLFRVACFGLKDPLRLRYPPSLEQTRQAALRAQQGQQEDEKQVAPTSTSSKQQGGPPRSARTGSDVAVSNPIRSTGGLAAWEEEEEDGGGGIGQNTPPSVATSHLSPNLASTLRAVEPRPLSSEGGTPPRSQIKPPSGKAPPALGSTFEGRSPARQQRRPQPAQVGSRQVSTATVRRISTFGGPSNSDAAAASRSFRMRRMSTSPHQGGLLPTAEDAVLHSSDEEAQEMGQQQELYPSEDNGQYPSEQEWQEEEHQGGEAKEEEQEHLADEGNWEHPEEHQQAGEEEE